ncbi:MAG: metal-dependent phosphohydrolase [Deltaproteobacteria bacterium RIFOXYD12_FULL_50_9]|nr:MAG: metal-dependent phosphohydrolase [Deltaproteobacteria bacterium RIFOXYD12_FULL_50_9]
MGGPELTIEQRLKRIQNFIDRMPSLSTTVTKVLEVCNKPNTSPNDLNRVISLDPVLTGQVLKLINSAYYSLPNQITSLTRAIIMLGLNTVKNLAISTAVLGAMGNEKSFLLLPMDSFWIHSICVGVTAKALAAKLGVPRPELEEYFVAGLLHDLGKIPLNYRFAEEYKDSLDLANLEQGPLYRAEAMIFGFDHALVGKTIAEKWQLSSTIGETLGFHHDPEGASAANRKLVTVVALANLYANVYEIGFAGDRFQEGPTIYRTLDLVGIKWGELAALQEAVAVEIDKAQVFLRVVGKGKG